MGWVTLHFIFIIAFALRDLVSNLPGKAGVLPARSNQFWRHAEAVTSAGVGEGLPVANPVRQSIAAYASATGIEAGYSYFAPSVPGNGKLVFELHYPDGRVEYDLPHVGGAAAGYRLATLLDILQQFHYAPLRVAMFKMLAYPVWQKHPDATTIRAVFGVIDLPTMAEFKAGKKRSYDLVYSYDFGFRPKSPDSKER